MNVSLREIRKVGDPVLYLRSDPVRKSGLPELQPDIKKMFALITEFRRVWGSGRAIAAPQVGLSKRFVCLNIDRQILIVNPVLHDMSDEMTEVWDDCMSFPNLMVKVNRHLSCKMSFLDEDWKKHTWDLEGDLSELFQHEVDHLDGILATMRCTDKFAFRWREPKKTR